MTTQKWPLDRIKLGDRRREEMGDIQGLQRSLERYGLINAVTVDEQGVLVTGGRRLRAAYGLNWTEIDVKSHGEISEQERLEIELEENVQRKGLTQAEKDRNLLKRAEVAKQVLGEHAAEGGGLLATRLPKAPWRPTDPTSDRSVAEYLGITHTALQNAGAHVKAIDTYPVLENKGQKAAIRQAAEWDALPAAQRARQVREYASGPRQRGTGPSAVPAYTPTRLSRKAKPPLTGAIFLHGLYEIHDWLEAGNPPPDAATFTRDWPPDDAALFEQIALRVQDWLAGFLSSSRRVSDESAPPFRAVAQR